MRCHRVGDLLFVSGQVGRRSDNSPETGFAQQVRLVFSILEQTLFLHQHHIINWNLQS